MIETHAHIYDKTFDSDRDEMLQRALNKGVEEIWMPNCSVETIEPMLSLANQYDFCKPMMGLHPCYVTESYVNALGTIYEEFKKRTYFMIGEIGLDYYWDLSLVDEQEKAFLTQLEWAKEFNIPICIHSRNSKDKSKNAIQRCCDLIETFGWKELRGIFHCFSGDLEDAKRVESLHFKLGIGGVSTFKNGGLDKVLPYINPTSIVLETDAPYLAPTPFRGKRNEVAYVDLVAERVSLLIGKTKTEVVDITTANAKSLVD